MEEKQGNALTNNVARRTFIQLDAWLCYQRLIWQNLSLFLRYFTLCNTLHEDDIQPWMERGEYYLVPTRFSQLLK